MGEAKALELTENCLPISTQEAVDILLIGGMIYSDGYDFYRHVSRIAEQFVH